MRTLLVITKQPSLAAAPSRRCSIRSSFSSSPRRPSARRSSCSRAARSTPTILDVELTDARAIRAIEELKSFAPGCPILVYAGEKQWEWEEDAYLLGVEHVLTKPVRGKLLNTLLDRLFPDSTSREAARPPGQREPSKPPSLRPYVDQVRALEALRRFSGVLTHSLDCHRAAQAIPPAPARDHRRQSRDHFPAQTRRRCSATARSSPDDRWLRSACAIGLDQSVLQHFALSLGAGIGGHLHRQGRILRASSHEAQAQPRDHQGIPAPRRAGRHPDPRPRIAARRRGLRRAADRRALRQRGTRAHLPHARGSRPRHPQLLAARPARRQSRDDRRHPRPPRQRVRGRRRATSPRSTRTPRPAAISSATAPGKARARILRSAAGARQHGLHRHQDRRRRARLQVQAAASARPDFRVSILPFRTQRRRRDQCRAAHHRGRHRARARAAARDRGRRICGWSNPWPSISRTRSAIRSCRSPRISSCSRNRSTIPSFRNRSRRVLACGVKRISRLANQMVFLAREWQGEFRDSGAISDLIVEAFHEAHTFHPGKKLAQLTFNKDIAAVENRRRPQGAAPRLLRDHAQRAPGQSRRSERRRASLRECPNGRRELQVEVRDSGQRLHPETAQRAPEPFFSTRNVGLGLGLTVSRKIIESHHGRIEIPSPQKGEPGIVRVSLPLQN